MRRILRNEKGVPIACHIIGGQSVLNSSLMEVFNPSTGQVIGVVSDSLPKGNLDDIQRDAHEAQECWYHEVTEQEKEQVFRTIIAKIEENRGAIARTMVLEGGKLWRWADAEIQETIDTLWHYHGEISRCYTHDGFTRCQMPDKNAFSILKPYGLILGIFPWNFPLAILFWKLCGALAGGNAIVLKAAEQTPFTAEIAVSLIRQSIHETIADSKRLWKLRSLVQLVQGRGETSGKLLVEELDYDLVTFTGSGEVGFNVAAIAASRRKNGRPYGRPCHLELGGHAAMVVLDDFDIDLAVAEAINANLGDSGQRCVSARVVFVQESKFKEFTSKYLERAQARVIGDPMSFSTEMGPLISHEQLTRVLDQIAKTTDELGKGPVLELGPSIGNFTPLDKKLRQGYYCGPTVFIDVPYGVTAMDEEIFGPVLVINHLPGRTREEAFWNAVELGKKSYAGLSNSLLTNDRRLTSKAPWYFNTGIFYEGRGPTGAELNKYFAAIKASGWGIEGKGLESWTCKMQVYDDYHGKARMAQAGADEKVKKLISEAQSPLEI